MYSSDVDYYRATSVADAVQMLKKNEGAKLLGRRQPRPRDKCARPIPLLVDIGRIKSSRGSRWVRGR
jgi:CO/xanthine dehydrogenase FAD-binding subunit